MRNPGGYAVWTEQGSVKTERDTFTCQHCSMIVIVAPPGTQPQAHETSDVRMCPMCAKPVCGKCIAMGKCDPFEEKLARMEHRASLARTVDREIEERFRSASRDTLEARIASR